MTQGWRPEGRRFEDECVNQWFGGLFARVDVCCPLAPASPPPGSLPGLPAHRKPSPSPFYWCWGPCLQCNAQLREQISTMSTHSTVHGTDLSVCGYPDLSFPVLPPSILFLHPSLSFSLRGREATRGGGQSQPVEAGQGNPLLKLDPALQQCDQVPLAPPFPGAPGAATRNCPSITDRSWQGLCVVSRQTFLSWLCPWRSGLRENGGWRVVDAGSKGPPPPGRLVSLRDPHTQALPARTGQASCDREGLQEQAVTLPWEMVRLQS